MRTGFLAFVLVLIATSLSAQDVTPITLQRSLLRCQAALYPLLSKQADGQLVDVDVLVKAIRTQFEKVNAGKTVDDTWKVVDAQAK